MTFLEMTFLDINYTTIFLTKNRPLDITLNEGFSYKFKLKIAKDDRSEMKNTGVQYEMKPQMKEKQECFNDNDQEGIYLRSKIFLIKKIPPFPLHSSLSILPCPSGQHS